MPNCNYILIPLDEAEDEHLLEDLVEASATQPKKRPQAKNQGSYSQPESTKAKKKRTTASQKQSTKKEDTKKDQKKKGKNYKKWSK